jgi:hypothetical protein
MDRNIDTSLKNWLSSLADRWNMPVDQAALSIGADEVHNRLIQYSSLHQILLRPDFSIDDFEKIAISCWALGGQFNLIRFTRFVRNGSGARDCIQALIENFPDSHEGAMQRIDAFVQQAVELGYRSPTGSDRAGAGLLASVILTAVFPDRFVDFRAERWRKFATMLGSDCSTLNTQSYGQKLIWSGNFARDISQTETYRLYWGEAESLWVIAGITWTGVSPEKPDSDPVDIDEIESFPEGRAKRKLHLARERNQTLVTKAKQRGLIKDPLLRCEVCGFSFVENYGEIGKEFIEAHHLQPVASLKPGSRSQVEDIGLLCANCHRMIHRGSRTLSLQELRDLLPT